MLHFGGRMLLLLAIRLESERFFYNEILRIAEAYRDEFLREWFQTFGGMQP